MTAAAQRLGIGKSLWSTSTGATACGEWLSSAPVAGSTAPADGSAASKVLLAGRPGDEIRSHWDAGSVQTRHASIGEPEVDLERVRLHGWASVCSTNGRWHTDSDSP